jgi:hypothetical protein
MAFFNENGYGNEASVGTLLLFNGSKSRLYTSFSNGTGLNETGSQRISAIISLKPGAQSSNK